MLLPGDSYRLNYGKKILRIKFHSHPYFLKNPAKINDLIKDCTRNPFKGISKPEPLKGNYAGFWSRGIMDEHRLVCTMKEGCLDILQCQFHYDR